MQLIHKINNWKAGMLEYQMHIQREICDGPQCINY